MRYLLKHWQGRQPLGQSFWVNLVAVSVLGCLVEYLIHQYFQYSDYNFLTIAISYFVFFHVFIFTWQAVGVLRACDHNIKNYISSGWTRGAQFFLLTGFTATLIWGISLGQQLWKLKTDAEQLAVELNTKPGYSITFIDINTVSIVGIISPGITRELKGHLVMKPGIVNIEFNSTGGNIFEARGIAKLIQERKLNTHISGNCYSSCTTAFIAGHTRTLGENARLGFHQYRVNSIKLFAPNVNVKKELDKDIASFLKQGVSQAFLDRAFSIPHDDMWFPSHSELIEAGIVN